MMLVCQERNNSGSVLTRVLLMKLVTMHLVTWMMIGDAIAVRAFS